MYRLYIHIMSDSSFLLSLLLLSSLSLSLLPLFIVLQDNGSPRLARGVSAFEMLEHIPGVGRLEKMVKVEYYLNILISCLGMSVHSS